MGNRCSTLWILGLIALSSCARFAPAQTPQPLPEPAAILDVSQSLPEESAQLTLAIVAFSSDNLLTVEIYRAAVQGPQFAQYLVQWENGSFKRSERTQALRWGEMSSTDGSRRLFEFSKRKVPRFQHFMETLATIMTLGMSGPEDVNREAVLVIDSSTKKSCFDWHRSFDMDWRRGRFATISPSGDLVAITVDNKILIYRLPVVCGGPTKMHKWKD